MRLSGFRSGRLTDFEMKKNVYVVFTLLCGFQAATAQLVYNKGASIYVAGADVYIQGGLQNDDSGGNQGVIDVSTNGATKGTITLTTTTGDFINGTGAELILRNDSYFKLTGNWTNAGSVDAQGGPVGSEVTFNGAAAQAYNHTAGATAWKFYNLRVKTPAINLSNDIFVKAGGLLTFEGSGSPANLINTGARRVAMEQNGSAAAAFAGINSSNLSPGIGQNYNYINGNLRWLITGTGKTTYEFPIGGNGSNTLQYMQLDFSASPFLEGILNLDAYYDMTLPGLPTLECGFGNMPQMVPYTGTWYYDAGGVENLVSSNYTLTMHPRAYATPGTNLGLTIDHGNGWILAKDGMGDCVVPTVPYLLSAPAQTEFSQAGGLDLMQPLPIEALQLSATPLSRSIRLKWTTIREYNTATFDLERSNDGRNFKTLKAGFPAAGFSDTPKDYPFEDGNVAFNTRYFYRVRAIDRDGAVTYSNVATAILNGKPQAGLQVSLYPNPTDGALVASFSADENTQTVLSVFDATGKYIFESKLDVSVGASVLSLDSVLERLAAGVYQFVFRTGDEVATHKVIKK